MAADTVTKNKNKIKVKRNPIKILLMPKIRKKKTGNHKGEIGLPKFNR